MTVLLFTILTLSVLGILAAVILYFVAKKFNVEEDPRIDDVEKMLPGANCGGCGFAGCRAMAEALVTRDNISSLYCPVAGVDTMKSISSFLGKNVAEKSPMVATLRCGGTCEKRPKVNTYNGARSCAVVNTLYVGESGCAFGCIGYGDCVAVCPRDAIRITERGVAEIDPQKCIGCGLCARTCPNHIIHLVPDTVKTVVKCSSHNKGAQVRKVCSNGCIACGKCEKSCPSGAIKVENNLATIDYEKCTGCGICHDVCPVKCIHAGNFICGAHFE
jgi:Na+-translocating ferredoxin:NAD+ oxidoreductase RNF subunit RnfB